MNRTGQQQKRAVIVVPHREQERWERACHEDCESHDERVVGVIVMQGRDPDRWRDAETMIEEDEADVIVVGRWDHIPHQALRDVRVIAEEAQRIPGQRRRPRVIG